MSKLVWISVGGADCEPARIENGKVYTIGCPDPLPFDKVTIESESIIGRPSRPRTPKEQADFEEWLKEERKAGRHHGYKRFT